MTLLGQLLGRWSPQQDQASIDRLLQLSKQRDVPPTSIAPVHAGLGNKLKALDSLECAYDVRDTRVSFMNTDGRWGLVKDEPRFQLVLKGMKLH